MLELINTERRKAGVDPVALGTNAAAQLHAESMLDNCFSSHWGIDGMKPYMRYTLAGVHQSNGENISGSDYCITATSGYRALSGIEQEMAESMNGLVASPGHLKTILNPWYKKVNIGLAWDRYNLMLVQQFEGDHIVYAQSPIIDNGMLEMSGTVKNEAVFYGDRDLSIQIHYDPPPRILTRGQLSRTYCSNLGLRVAALRPPLTGNRYYPENDFVDMYSPCPDPYEIPKASDPPRSPGEAHRFWQEAYEASRLLEERSIVVPWVTALEFDAYEQFFSVKADLTEIVAERGSGVYTVLLWAFHDSGESVLVSEYSIFVE